MNSRNGVFILALWCAGTGPALAQANSIEAFEVTPQPGKTVVRITMREPLATVPPNFSVVNPARIAVDFQGAENALGRTSQDIGQGDLRSMNVVQGADRTRLVLNLRRPVVYETAIDGRSLVISLPTAVAVSAPPGAAPGSAPAQFAAGRSEGRHAIREVDFRRGRSGEGRVIVDLSDTSTGIDIRQQGQTIVVDFLKATLPENLRRRMDVVDFATPVQAVSAFQQGENVRVLIEPKGLWEHNAYQSETQFVVEVRPLSPDSPKAAAQSRYSGQKLSLNFQNVEVRAVLNVIADFTDLNIITSDTVTGNITLRLKDVPWDQAMEIILQTRGLDSRRSGNVVWIAPRDELATREKLALEAQQQINDLELTKTESFQVNYQKAAEIQKLLSDPQQKILSKRGSAVVDGRTNTLFVQDTPSRLDEVRKLLAKIDIPVRQVMIEARIVEAADTFAKNLGVRLGYNDQTFVSAPGNLPGERVGGPNTRVLMSGNYVGSGLRTGQTPDPGTGYFPDSYNVNMPVAGLNSLAPGSLSLTLFRSSMTKFINAELTALEADGKGKIVSSPRVMTADQVEALIEQGTELPYQQASSSGATAIAWRKANLSLKVKPQITPDGNVIMTLEVNKDAVGATTPFGVQINTKHVRTEVLVENGGTIVIGGIYEQNERTDVTRIPFFGDLPLIGYFFRNTTHNNNKTELLVFITPRIISERLTTVR